MALPKQLDWTLAQTQWANQLDPIIKNQLLQGNLIQDVQLKIGDNVINHKLGRKQIGFIITDINAGSVIYRSAALNALTLTLNSSAVCTVSIWCF